MTTEHAVIAVFSYIMQHDPVKVQTDTPSNPVQLHFTVVALYKADRLVHLSSIRSLEQRSKTPWKRPLHACCLREAVEHIESQSPFEPYDLVQNRMHQAGHA